MRPWVWVASARCESDASCKRVHYTLIPAKVC